MASFDVVVVGGGHNGLVAAAYLSKAGFRVLILERRPLVGGACVTEEVFPGYRLATGAYAYSLFRPQIISDLKLEEFDLQVVAKDPQYFVPYPDGEHIFLWGDSVKTVKEVERFSYRDARNYKEYLKFWDEARRALEPLLLKPPSSIKESMTSSSEVLESVFFKSAKELLDENFESEHLKAALGMQGVIGTNAGPGTPGTAFILGYHLLGEIAGKKGVWGYVKGGMGSLTRALWMSAQRYGSQLMLNVEVTRIDSREGAVTGVTLSDGRKIESKVVISNADPKRTFLKLVGEEGLPKDFVQKIRALKTEGVVAKVLCALDELPDFKALPGLGPQNKCTAGICPSLEYLERAWMEAKSGRPSSKPFMEVFAQSAVDPSVAPPGKHALSIFTQYAPYHIRDRSWSDVRESFGDTVIDTLAEYAPNLERTVTDRLVLSPLDLESRFYLTEGNIFHTEMFPDQIFDNRPLQGWCNYRTPIKNLYLCGAGAHPGGGVIGAPGYNAANAVIEDLKAARGEYM